MKSSIDIYYSFLAICTTLMLQVAPAFALSVEPVAFERPNVLAFHLQSQILEQPMLVEVMLPLSYGSDASRNYPVMYVVDGLMNFPLVSTSNLNQGLSYDPPMPEVITVGIDFIETDSVRDFKRAEYFTPVESEDEDYGRVGGKADQYIDFLNHELKQFIHATFTVDTEREVLGGHSLAGLLSLYTLFTKPDSFDAYIAASPSIYWADEAIFDIEKNYVDEEASSKAVLFMSVGTAEDPWGITLDYVSRMAERIKERSYHCKKFKMKKFRRENHSSVIGPAFKEGGRFVFRKLEQ